MFREFICLLPDEYFIDLHKYKHISSQTCVVRLVVFFWFFFVSDQLQPRRTQQCINNIGKKCDVRFPLSILFPF